MAKKKTLPDNFSDIIDSGNMDAFKKVFEKCEITAANKGKTTCNAFSYRNLKPFHIQFLIDNGLEANADCGFGYPAISFHAADKDNLKCLLDNGADINFTAVPYRGNALARACSSADAKAVRNLLEANASVNVKGDADGKTLLDTALAHCENGNIPAVLEISEMLIKAGVLPTDKTAGYVKQIGERFEFYKSEMDEQTKNELGSALNELYKLLDAAPVPERETPNGKIFVRSKNWHEQFNELRNMLVPASGKAQTVQGEVIRIVGKITHEVLDNGGINWGSEYKKMLDELTDFLQTANSSNAKNINEAVGIINNITPTTDKKTLYRLAEIIVEWVLANPDLILLDEANCKK